MLRGLTAVMLAGALLALAGCGGGEEEESPLDESAAVRARAVNVSTVTKCAEEDNVNVPLQGAVQAFTIEATHPGYTVGEDNCNPNFANCSGDTGPAYPFTPGVFKLFDDGVTVLEAVREATWWRPRGMTAWADSGARVRNIHYVRLYRRIDGSNEWPQVAVLYADGNLRLIPQPPLGRSSVCFGSSVIVGPAAVADRPLAEILRVRYVSASQSLRLTYREGGEATLRLDAVDRLRTRVRVAVRYPTDARPFATFRSMFVSDGNADVDRVQWTDRDGLPHNDRILKFTGGRSSAWRFLRKVRSQHNTSAPDLRIALVK